MKNTRCMFLRNGKCHSLYFNGKCDGHHPPKNCPYTIKDKKEDD